MNALARPHPVSELMSGLSSNRNANDWDEIFSQIGAVWTHAGDVHTQPFVRTSSGLISSGCFRGRKVQERPDILSAACAAFLEHPSIVRYLKRRIHINTPLDRVVGPATSGIALASHLALLLGAKTAFADKAGAGYSFAGFSFSPHERVLIVDDTITSGSTFLGVRDALLAAEPTLQIIPVVLVLCNRSNRSLIESHIIISLICRDFPRWCEGENPHTRDGQEILPPVSVRDSV